MIAATPNTPRPPTKFGTAGVTIYGRNSTRFWSGRKASRPAKLYESQRIPKTTVIFSENTGYRTAFNVGRLIK